MESLNRDWYALIGEVKNQDDYKKLHGMVQILSGDECADWKVRDNYVSACKKRMREYAHSDNTMRVYFGHEVKCVIVKDNGIDGYVERIQFPKECETYEDAISFFEAYLYIEPRYSAFDCTGCLFTSWYHIFKRNGRYCAYHAISADV